MTFLVFDDESTAQIALDQVDVNFGCPFTLENGYTMERWDELVKKYDENLWSFFKPYDDKMIGVQGWIDEIANRENWSPSITE